MENTSFQSPEVTPQPSQKPFVSTALVVFIMILLTAFSYFVGYKRGELKNAGPNVEVLPSPPLERACTLEAKICPDGSSVGRTGPNCEFSACPTTSSSSEVGDVISTLPISGNFQEFFQKVCTNDTVSIDQLPFKFDTALQIQPLPQDRTKSGMALCVKDFTQPERGGGYIQIPLANNRWLTIYDEQSVEGPHDSTPSLGTVGEVFEESTATKLNAFIPFNNGPAIMGELPLWIRGTKSFFTQTGQTVSVNINLEAIAKDDPRLLAFWQPFGQAVSIEGFPPDQRELSFTQTNGLFLNTVQNFFKPVAANTGEAKAVEQVKNELKMVQAK